MNYLQTINYLYSQLPLFTRDGLSAYKADLNNTIALCELVGNPHNSFKSMHVGGTNGKGSTSHMLAAVLQIAGYKTGLYTSPHLKDFRERIRINGEMIGEDTVVDFVAAHKADFETIKPSFFEMTVALAFEVFAKEEVDIAIIEVGLGGRLDSTNIITPLLSVITNIGWDHMNILGDTMQLIATEKAGIIKPGVPVIIGEYQPEVSQIFIEKAQQANSTISFASNLLKVDVINAPNNNDDLLTLRVIPGVDSAAYKNNSLELQLDLTGTYQLKNIKTVLCAVEELRSQGFNITNDHIKTALKQVKTLTGLHGRWEVLSRQPLTICDTGHNPEGMEEVLKNISATGYTNLHFILGVVNDKDITRILKMLPTDATYYFCRPDIPRGLEAEILKIKAQDHGLNGIAFKSVTEALEAARAAASTTDLIFVGGSTFVVAEVV